MPYWQNVVRSFEIPWRHRYLWLLALFAGESGGGFSFSYSQGVGNNGGSNNPGAAAQQMATWLSQHTGLIVAVFLIWLVVLILLFILAAVCEGALIRGSAEHDAERPYRLGQAWRSGVGTAWLIVRFRLLLIALALPALLVLGLVIAGFVLAIVHGNTTVAVLLGLVGLLVVLLAIVYSIYLSFLDRLGIRTAILEQQPAVASIARAHRLLIKRFGRVLLVWLISIATGIVTGIVSTLVLVLAGLPAIISILILVAGGPAWLWFVFGLGLLLLLAVAIPTTAYLAAQSSTYWTLAFRRMDIDYPPAYGSAAAPPVPAA